MYQRRNGFLWTGDVAVFIRQKVCVLTQFEHPAQCLVTVFRLHSGTGAGRDEIVRHYRGRNAAEVLHGALTSFDEVFLALGPYRLTVSVVAERQYRDEHLCFFSLARHAVDHLKAVSGKVDVHLVSGIMLHMSDHLDAGTDGEPA